MPTLNRVIPRGGTTGATPRVRRRRRRAGVLAIVIALALGLAACGGSSSGGAAGTSSSGGAAGTSSSAGASRHVHFAKTKFVLHAGLAFGAFHRYIYKPFRSGGFTPPLQHKAAIIKAGVAALFVYHEVKIALVDAQSSPLLSKLVSPLTALQNKLNGLHQSLSGGHLNSQAISTANGAVSNIASQSANSGAAIHEIATSNLGGG